MALTLPTTPPQSAPPMDNRGGDTSLPPLFSRVWWIFFNTLATTLTTIIAAIVNPLSSAGKLVKVGANPGTLEESSITDNGITVVFTEPITIDTGATPATSHIAIKAAGSGTVALLCYAQNNGHVAFDQNWTGAAWVASSTTVARIVKAASGVEFRRASGATIGSAVSDTLSAVMLTSNGFWGFGGNAAPGYAVDSTGDVNVSGVYRVAGTQVVGPQLSAITAPSGGGTGVSAPSGGATIDSQARTAIGSIISAISSGGNTVDPAARTAINTIIARLKSGTGHGLTA